MRRHYIIGTLLATLACVGSAQLSAQESDPGAWQWFLIRDGKTVYDVVNQVTWLADANLPAKETFGLPPCPDLTIEPTEPCVNLSGSMNYESAVTWVEAMNAYVDPVSRVVGYLVHTDWVLPPLDASCPTYGCGGVRNPMGNLYYDQLKKPAGTPVVPLPHIAVGPFHHLVPIPYWSCLADTIQDACEPTGTGPGNEPSADSEWGFSFVTGFLGTERLTANHFVTAYYVGCNLPDPERCLATPPPKAPIPPKCPPGGGNCNL